MIAVRRTYIPRPGSGGKLLALRKEASDAMAEAGFPRPTVYRAWHGGHGSVFTEQHWESVTAYEESRGAVRLTGQITAVFDKIYPLLAQTHDTQLLEIMG